MPDQNDPQVRSRRPSMPRVRRAEAPGEPVLVDSKKLKALTDQLKATAAERDALKAELEEVAAQAEELQAKVDEYLLALQRERAEFVNFKRRTAEERQRDMGLAGVDLIGKVLNLADDFDRAIETRPAELEGNAWADGIAAIDRKLRLLLESEGVTQVEASPGTTFDPREHEAITTVPGTGRPENEIVGEIRRGYRLRDRVIRPALVAVAAGDGGTDSLAN